ncbi:MAG: cytochrome c oxidase subunit II [Planctomycetaceae bacterium]|nr:cytochrome c oxidase subunit II [Planctomycetaceae bacterium]
MLLSLFAQRSLWLPPESSNLAGRIDEAFMVIYWLSVICFVGIIGAMVLFTIKYKRKEGVEPPKSRSHWLGLELVWSIIPFIIVLFLFYEGFAGYTRNFVPPTNSSQITVLGKKWQWSFLYPEAGYDDKVLHVPVNTPIQLNMTSDDVVHSLFVPDFRVKKDVIPGRYTTLWFEALEPGSYNLFCAEYCGQQHSDMITKVVVHPSLEEGKDADKEKESYADADLMDPSIPYEVWLAIASDIFRNVDSGNETLADVGRTLFEKRGCNQCHSITADSENKKGPPLVGAYGENIDISTGESVIRDDNYLLESIKDPAAKIRKGYQPVMPSFTSQFKNPREYIAVVEYIKQLNNVGGETAKPSSPESTSDESAQPETTNTAE